MTPDVERAPYEAPDVTCFGTVEELTAGTQFTLTAGDQASLIP